ncbi:MAG: hypothetical protein V4583_20495 [Pseudomonadota bacterium]
MPRHKVPRLIRFLLSRFVDGAVLGLAVGLAILWSDLGEVARLLAASKHDAVLTALFFGHTALLFGTFGMCVAVMNLTDRD